MIRLVLPEGPQWQELLPGVRLYCDPVTSVEQSAARAFADRRLRELGDGQGAASAAGGGLTGIVDLEDPDRAQALRELYYAQGLGRQIIRQWEGVGDADGHPVEVTPETVDQFMRVPYARDLFIARVAVSVAQVFAEGNASTPDSAGSTEAGQPTANGAARPTPPAAGASAAPTGTPAP